MDSFTGVAESSSFNGLMVSWIHCHSAQPQSALNLAGVEEWNETSINLTFPVNDMVGAVIQEAGSGKKRRAVLTSHLVWCEVTKISSLHKNAL